jgi:signal peptidase I
MNPPTHHQPRPAGRLPVYALLALIPALFVAAIRGLCLIVTVEGASMEPALSSGDRVLALRRWPARWLRRGQIVIVQPGQPALPASTYIKRVAGLPGDVLATSLADIPPDQRLGLPWAHDQAGQFTWHIPPRSVFVRGDHQAHSIDSAMWGPIPASSLRGLVVLRLARRPAEDQP